MVLFIICWCPDQIAAHHTFTSSITHQLGNHICFTKLQVVCSTCRVPGICWRGNQSERGQNSFESVWWRSRERSTENVKLVTNTTNCQRNSESGRRSTVENNYNNFGFDSLAWRHSTMSFSSFKDNFSSGMSYLRRRFSSGDLQVKINKQTNKWIDK